MPEQVADRRLDPVAEGIDLAIRLGPIRDEAPIARRLGDHGRIACAAPAYLARHGAPAVPADFLRHNCILLDQPDHLNLWRFRGADGAIEHIRIRGNFRSDNGDALIELLPAGPGIARAADFVALPLIAAGRLVPILPDAVSPAPVQVADSRPRLPGACSAKQRRLGFVRAGRPIRLCIFRMSGLRVSCSGDDLISDHPADRWVRLCARRQFVCAESHGRARVCRNLGEQRVATSGWLRVDVAADGMENSGAGEPSEQDSISARGI